MNHCNLRTQVYNDVVFDLLDTSHEQQAKPQGQGRSAAAAAAAAAAARKQLKIREDGKGNVCIPGLSEVGPSADVLFCS